ncbi:hypothetical protein E4U11_005826, partial [Claviceps purpurea]
SLILDSSSPLTSSISDDFPSSECHLPGTELEDESILRLTQQFLTLGSPSMSAPASAAPVAMDTPFNHPPSVELFNGSGDITSWLKKFRRAYRRANGNRDPGPSDLIQAMDIALTGDAATFVGNSTLLSHIVDQADIQ